jgi:hypothetical protein
VSGTGESCFIDDMANVNMLQCNNVSWTMPSKFRNPVCSAHVPKPKPGINAIHTFLSLDSAGRPGRARHCRLLA